LDSKGRTGSTSRKHLSQSASCTSCETRQISQHAARHLVHQLDFATFFFLNSRSSSRTWISGFSQYRGSICRDVQYGLHVDIFPTVLLLNANPSCTSSHPGNLSTSLLKHNSLAPRLSNSSSLEVEMQLLFRGLLPILSRVWQNSRAILNHIELAQCCRLIGTSTRVGSHKAMTKTGEPRRFCVSRL
jgi:hypothetical protein